ncbi:MAG: FMN-binding protein [Lachnospiraceae bacterium]|nr:FMN-binding protein [Lachnospiraceae bacterium]
MKHLIKDTLILFVITLVAGGLLGFVNELTKEPIAEYEAEKKEIACSEVFYEEDENGNLVAVKDLIFEPLTDAGIAELNAALIKKDLGNIVIEEVYHAYVAPEYLYGYVFGITTKEGYNGEISFYVGITSEGRLKGVSLLDIAETPGLGMNAEDVLLPQFRDVEAGTFKVVKTGAQGLDEIDAISGATITSEAITGGVNAAYECFVILQGGEAS